MNLPVYRTTYRVSFGPTGYTEAEIPMSRLQPGDYFRLEEPDGEEVVGLEGGSLFRVTDWPDLKEGNVVVPCEELFKPHDHCPSISD